MQKWEYKYVPIINDLLQDFNKLGDEGWELVLMTSRDYIFKRKKL